MKGCMKLALIALFGVLVAVGCTAQTEISFISNPEGATIFLDGEELNKTTNCILRVEPGTHVIKLRLTGYEDFDTTVVVQEGERVIVDAQLDIID